MKTFIKLGMVALLLGFISACSPPASSLKKTLEENPDILFNVIEKHPAAFFKVVETAGAKAREAQQGDQFKNELVRMQTEWKSPKKVSVDDARAYNGTKESPVTIVEYFDYNCGYCGTAHTTVSALKEKYGDKIRVVYKHLPILSDTSRTAAEYMEAIRLQDKDKAYEFHSILLEAQGDLRSGGEKFLKDTAKKVGANMSKLAKDSKGSKVKGIIDADVKEARSLEFSGTPGFMVNGAAVRGAYPQSFFEEAIDLLLASNK